jgi:hypothetical protein
MVEALDHGCRTHKTYTCHTVQNTIRYDIRFTGMKVRYTIFERVNYVQQRKTYTTKAAKVHLNCYSVITAT